MIKPKSGTGMILVVIGLVLISMMLTLGRSGGWSDTTRGILTGIAVGLEVLGLAVLLLGLPTRRKQA